jgi:3-amino-4-hydroxybenzoic acid synthase
MKTCWLDLRSAVPDRRALCLDAIQQGIDAVVAADPADLDALPATITKVLIPTGADGWTTEDWAGADFGPADIVIVSGRPDPARLAQEHPDRQFGRFVDVDGPDSLDTACRSARTQRWTVLRFRDPTKIPLEIVLAAAADAGTSVITVAEDPTEAAILFGVLERGSDGVMMAPARLGDAARLRAAGTAQCPDLELVELSVTGIEHVGMGERACVDTCSYLRPDEGILVGSQARGLVLCASETHPLPYMPTRPFRVNAGAVMSYTLGAGRRTRYLSELGAGGVVLAVNAKGQSRLVTVGRVKIETRPLLSVNAVGPDGRPVNVILQDDWHVRVLGPGAAVLNSTALGAGDRILGHLIDRARHVGYPIDELCYEQ